MAFRLRCPICRKAFAFDPATEKYPEQCPLCETYIGAEQDDDVIPMPFIRSSGSTKRTDDLYRQIETASEGRAAEAASMLGVPTAEMSDLKITNLRDAKHEGDVAAVPVSNDVSRFMDANPQAGGFQTAGLQYSQGSMVGPEASAGARMRSALQRVHNDRGNPVSERPGLETLQPGYRRRG